MGRSLAAAVAFVLAAAPALAGIGAGVRALGISLPETEGEHSELTEPWGILITAEGRILSPAQGPTAMDLLASLRALAATRAATPIVVAADAKGPAGPVGMLLDQCALYGLDHVSLRMRDGTLLPARKAAGASDAPALRMRVPDMGGVFLKDRPVPVEQIGQALSRRGEAEAKALVLLEIAEKCDVGRLCQVVAAVAGAGAAYELRVVRTGTKIHTAVLADALAEAADGWKIQQTVGGEQNQAIADAAANLMARERQRLADALPAVADHLRQIEQARDRLWEAGTWPAGQSLPKVALPEIPAEGLADASPDRLQELLIASGRAAEALFAQVQAMRQVAAAGGDLARALEERSPPASRWQRIELTDSDTVRTIDRLQDLRAALNRAAQQRRLIASSVRVMAGISAGAAAPAAAPGDLVAARQLLLGPDLMPDEMDLFTSGEPFGGRAIQPGRRVDGKTLQYVDAWFVSDPVRYAQPLAASAFRQPPNPLSPDELDFRHAADMVEPIVWHAVRTPLSSAGYTPPYRVEPTLVHGRETWFAFSEVRSDVERDAWIAVAVDDHGSLWVGGEQVWSSGARRKPYRPDEGIVKIRLRKGLTPLLLRVDNAGGTTGASVIFIPQTE